MMHNKHAFYPKLIYRMLRKDSVEDAMSVALVFREHKLSHVTVPRESTQPAAFWTLLVYLRR